MRKICRRLALVLMVVLISALLCSCAGLEKDPLLGDWESTAEMLVLEGGGDTSSQTDMTSRLSFRSDGTGIWSVEFAADYPPVSQSFTYTAEDGLLTMIMENGDERYFGFSFSDGVLMLDAPRYKQEFYRVK